MKLVATIHDMPKLHSPFVREHINGHYVVMDKIEPGMEWVFEDEDVNCSEKLDGTSCAVYMQEGAVLGVWNRTTRIPFINRGKEFIIQGVQEAYSRKYLDTLSGEIHGEVIGPKIQSNHYKLENPLFVPFANPDVLSVVTPIDWLIAYGFRSIVPNSGNNNP